MPRETPERLLQGVGRRVAELRRQRGWTQLAFAEELGCSVRYVARIEAGGQNLTVHRLAWLAGHLEVRTVELFEEPKHDAVPARRIRVRR